MAMNQRDYYKQKINKLLPEFPEYIEDFVDTHYDNLSPLTLHRYLETYKNFLTWTIQETISSAENIKDVKLSTLENITKKEMESYFKNLSREEINGKYVKVPYEKRYDVADYNNATIQFDKRGNDIYYYEYDSIRDITIKIEKTFNERDSLLTESHFDNELKPRTYRIVNTYNTDGFKIEKLFYDQDSLYERKVYEYNKNKLTKAVLYRKGKEIAHYSYDKEMTISSTDSKPKNEATADPYGESDEINHQEIYDSQGNLSQYKAIYKGGLEEERCFYYDMKGNCIRKEYFENGKPTYVIERKITYYQ